MGKIIKCKAIRNFADGRSEKGVLNSFAIGNELEIDSVKFNRLLSEGCVVAVVESDDAGDDAGDDVSDDAGEPPVKVANASKKSGVKKVETR